MNVTMDEIRDLESTLMYPPPSYPPPEPPELKMEPISIAAARRDEEIFEDLEAEARLEEATERLGKLKRKVASARKNATPAQIRASNRARKQYLEAKGRYVSPKFRGVSSGLSGQEAAKRTIAAVLDARSKLVEDTAKSISRKSHKAPKARQLPKIALPISKDKNVKKAARMLIKDDIRAAKAKVKALEHELTAMKPRHFLP